MPASACSTCPTASSGWSRSPSRSASNPACCCCVDPPGARPPFESARILEVLDRLPAQIAILIIEHDMELVFRFARRITVLVQGQVLCEGAPTDIAADARVREVYLGEGHHG